MTDFASRRPVCVFVLMFIILLSIPEILGISLLYTKKGDPYLKEKITAGEDTVTITGVVDGTEERDGSARCLLKKVTLVTNDGTRSISNVRLSLEEGEGYPSGYVLSARGKIKLPQKATNPGQFDSELYYKVQKIGYTMYQPQITVEEAKMNTIREGLLEIRRRMRSRFMSVYSKEDAGILSAMLLGDKNFLESEDKNSWQLGGISHMLAISGLHLTLIGMSLYQLLKRLGLPISISAGFAMGVLVVYAVFTGCSISTIRALIMFILAMGAPILKRTYDMPTALAIAVFLMLLENPYYLQYSAFQMSSSAVLICCLFQKRSKMTVSLMLYLGMLPLVLLAYSEIPLYSILLNLLLVPLLPFLLFSGFLGGMIGVPIASLPAAFLLKLIRGALSISTRLPFSSLILGKPKWYRILIYYILLSIWAYLMKKYRNYKRRMLYLLLAPVLVFLLTFHFDRRLTLTFLDVGQGDGCLITFPNQVTCLIDGGSSSAGQVGEYRILPAVKSYGIGTLDYVILTHMDSDHISGIKEILEMMAKGETSLRIKTVLLPYLSQGNEKYEEMISLAEKADCRVLIVREDDRIGIGRAELHFLNPDPLLDHGGEIDENGQCIVTALHYQDFDALLTGDVHGEGEEQVLDKLKQSQVHYEVLKVAHHGSRLSTSAEFLDEVRPNAGIISVGVNNSYGHPGAELLERLNEVGCMVYRTDRDGAIIVSTNGRKFTIEHFLDS